MTNFILYNHSSSTFGSKKKNNLPAPELVSTNTV